ncbi:MAG: FkbM family methyltransferase [candidate division KSB1 bacterium]|nr:FkbM family methyltransferase [candidate division KSB1 bacterium]
MSFWAVQPGRALPPSLILRAAVAKFFVHTPFCRRLSVQLDGYRLRFHPSTLSRYYWIYRRLLAGEEGSAARLLGTGVVEVVGLFRRLLRPGDIVIDVGANVGTLTCQAAARVGPTGRVHAFEPHPLLCRFLAENLELNSFRNVVVHCCALGDSDGEVPFAYGGSDEAWYVGASSAVVRRLAPGGSARIVVQVRRLDSFDIGDGDIALMKVDVEGYEGLVLHGAQRTLERCRAVVFEASDSLLARFGWSVPRIVDMLSGQGFRVLRPVLHTSTVLPVDRWYRPRDGVDHENLIAVRDLDRFVCLTGWRVENGGG